MNDSESLSVAPDTTLDVDLGCMNCGYNLRTMQHGAACPECGTSIEESVRSGMFAVSDPKWLRAIRKGASWVLVAVVVYALWRGLVLTASISGYGLQWIISAQFIPLAIATFGAWLITRPRRRSQSSLPRSWDLLRKAIRVLILIWIFCAACPYIYAVVRAMEPAIDFWWPYMVFRVFGVGVFNAMYAISLGYGGYLAGRMHMQYLSIWFYGLAFGVALGGVASVFVQMLMWAQIYEWPAYPWLLTPQSLQSIAYMFNTVAVCSAVMTAVTFVLTLLMRRRMGMLLIQSAV